MGCIVNRMAHLLALAAFLLSISSALTGLVSSAAMPNLAALTFFFSSSSIIPNLAFNHKYYSCVYAGNFYMSLSVLNFLRP